MGGGSITMTARYEENPQRARSEPSITPLSPTAPIVGRQQELTLAMQRYEAARHEQAHVVLVAGAPGIGKTSLAATLVDQIHEHFDYVFWRSLLNAPPLKRILQECIQFVSDQLFGIRSQSHRKPGNSEIHDCRIERRQSRRGRNFRGGRNNQD